MMLLIFIVYCLAVLRSSKWLLSEGHGWLLIVDAVALLGLAALVIKDYYP